MARSLEYARLTVRPVPRLTGTNWHSIANGYPITIYGKNFASDFKQNKVTIGGLPATVLSGTTSQLEVRVPNELANPQYGVPVVVRIDGGPPSNAVRIMIQSRWF